MKRRNPSLERFREHVTCNEKEDFFEWVCIKETHPLIKNISTLRRCDREESSQFFLFDLKVFNFNFHFSHLPALLDVNNQRYRAYCKPTR